MQIEWLGQLDFEACWDLQQAALERVVDDRSGESELAYLVEHPPIVTLGRQGLDENILSRQDLDGNPVPVVRINRGGDVTFHGPGQLVGYPVLDLTRRGRDVHKYLRSLELILIRVATELGIEAFRREKLTGVWTDQGKLASIGVGVRRWVTQHGFALNVCTDLGYFQMIHPCGMPDCRVTSLQELLDRPITIQEVLPLVATELKREFGLSKATAEPNVDPETVP